MRIALVHEYLNQFGGAERMLQALCELFPRAPIYTLLYDPVATRGVFRGRNIKTSFLQSLPFSKTHHHIFPLFMPLAIEQFDFSGYDIVLSLSASFAKGIITKPKTRHICYCLTPPRFLWDNSQKFVEDFGYPKLLKKLLPPFITYLRIWDREAAYRVDEFWAISDFVKQRVKKYYCKDAHVIYPPLPLSIKKQEASSKHKESDLLILNTDYFLLVGRLVSYKRFDLAIRAFNENSLPLKIVGVGPELKKLKSMAGRNIEFLGSVSDDKLTQLYLGARACVFPQEEDFGIVPLEAMAAGKPVIAYQGGGALETILDKKTGLFFDNQTPEALNEAIERFKGLKFKEEDCIKQAQKFNISVFKEKVLETLIKI